MNFIHLKCHHCERHFCCKNHRIDHENKNHSNQILPDLTKYKFNKEHEGKISVLDSKSAVSQPKPYLENDKIFNQSFIIPPLILLPNLSLRQSFKISDFIERPLELNMSQSIIARRNITSLSSMEPQSLQHACTNVKLSTEEIIQIKSNAVTREIHLNLKKRSYDSPLIWNGRLISNSPISPECKRRRVILPVRRRKIILVNNPHLMSGNQCKDSNPKSKTSNPPITPQNNFDLGIKANTPLTRTEIIDYIKIVEKSHIFQKNQYYTPLLSEILKTLGVPNDTSSPDPKQESDDLISTVLSNLNANITPVSFIKNNSDKENINHFPTPIFTKPSSVVSPLIEDNSQKEDTNSSPMVSGLFGTSDTFVSPLIKNHSEKQNSNYSDTFSGISTISDVISPIQNNLIKTSSPIISMMDTTIGTPSGTSNLSGERVPLIYQTPYGETTNLRRLTSTKQKGISVVTPLKGIMSKTPKLVTHNRNKHYLNESPKFRKVTFYEHGSNTPPLESVKEEDETILSAEELDLSVGNTNPERKGIFNTVADIVSTAMHSLPNLVRSSWEWGQEINNQPTTFKRLLTPEKQDVSARSPVAKRFCLPINRNLLNSPIKGRKPIRNYNLKKNK
uniref:C2H2-type domain-containing protein n=1 Tax=Clastoptera arizonana TaxID=38151 RepID=A0A1B6CPE7_9HEMI